MNLEIRCGVFILHGPFRPKQPLHYEEAFKFFLRRLHRPCLAWLLLHDRIHSNLTQDEGEPLLLCPFGNGSLKNRLPSIHDASRQIPCFDVRDG